MGEVVEAFHPRAVLMLALTVSILQLYLASNLADLGNTSFCGCADCRITLGGEDCSVCKLFVLLYSVLARIDARHIY